MLWVAPQLLVRLQQRHSKPKATTVDRRLHAWTDAGLFRLLQGDYTTYVSDVAEHRGALYTATTPRLEISQCLGRDGVAQAL